MAGMSTNAQLIGVPLDLGAENLGVEDGPAIMRSQDIIEKLSHAGVVVTDKGDIVVTDRKQLTVGDPKLRYMDEIVRVSLATAKLVEDALADKQKVIVIGGDHSVNLGAVSGASAALNGDLGLIYIDAHGDFNTPEITLSGNIHGMHLAALLGYGSPDLVNVHKPGAKIARPNLLHIGGSDFDAQELLLMQHEEIAMFTLFDMLSHGLAPLLNMIEKLSTQVSNFWVSLDLDVIDEVYAPGAAMPNRQGLSYREVSAIAQYIGMHCNVIGVDLVEYNPKQDVNFKTAELGIELIAKFFGTNYSWYTTYMEHNKLQ